MDIFNKMRWAAKFRPVAEHVLPVSAFPATHAAMALHPLIRHQPDPDHPGWMTWDLPSGDDRFNATLGKLLVRGEGEGRARCRMFPDVRQSNLGNIVHGGAILTFIDMAMFAGGYARRHGKGPYVTLDLSTHFLAAAKLGLPLDCSSSCSARPSGHGS
jgi:acyl-coenzyme A thioesterase PaaI-like protein